MRGQSTRAILTHFLPTFETLTLFGLENHFIDQAQYTVLVTVVILSAVVPTLIAQAFFLPSHEAAERIRAQQTPAPHAAITALNSVYREQQKGE